MANPLGLAVKIAMTAAASILLSHAAEAAKLTAEAMVKVRVNAGERFIDFAGFQ